MWGVCFKPYLSGGVLLLNYVSFDIYKKKVVYRLAVHLGMLLERGDVILVIRGQTVQLCMC